MCAHQGPFDGPLTCTRTDPHSTGHVYQSTSGGHDAHTESSGE